jgi:predicted DNA binding CopG/RHH family protein
MNKKIPEFKNEDDERDFWATESPLDHFDRHTAHRAIFPSLKPTLRSISLRLPIDMIEQLKVIANRQDVPYQSLIKTYLRREIITEKRTIALSAKLPVKRSSVRLHPRLKRGKK